MKIAIGLSGGVDSSVACHLLREQGHDVTGLTMKLWDSTYSGRIKKSACFGPDEGKDIKDAAELASRVGIPFHVIDLSKEYRSSILGYFREEYSCGKTPNPCMRCNRSMKFRLLLDRAKESGIVFDRFATGHYARVDYDATRGRYVLKRGLDPGKDQSYFLSLLGQEQLGTAIFPLGEYNKDRVRAIARSLGYPSSEKKESQDFYSGEHSELLDFQPVKGTIRDRSGKILGSHNGICNFTVGQRRGIGVSSSRPLYVTSIDCETNTVYVGTDEELFKSRLLVSGTNWIAIPGLDGEMRVEAKIRYMHKASQALISPAENGCVLVEFDSPQRAITPGQYAVFYDGDIVLGAGVIERTI